MSLQITDVTPRDGLQDAMGYVPLAEKIALIEGLVQAGLTSIEATAFVHPKWSPLVSDADILIPQLRHLDAEWIALVPNDYGLQRAIRAGVTTITLVVSASESHNQKNLNRSRADSLALLSIVTTRAHDAGLRVRGAISTAFDCPFEGRVPLSSVMTVAEKYLAMGVDEIGLADTLGTAHPALVKERIVALSSLCGPVPLGLHLHDRYGWALANVAIAFEYGVRHFESALGGLGGCPYAPGAAGNLDTERLVQFFMAQGENLCVDLDRLQSVRQRLFTVLSQHLSTPSAEIR